VQSLDLAGRGWRVGTGESMLNAVVQTDPIKEHVGRSVLEFPREYLAVEFLSDVKSYFVLFYPFSWDESIDGAPGDSFIRRLVPLLIVLR
jgi:hypothetical protein